MRGTLPAVLLATLALLPAAASAGLNNDGPVDPSISDGSAQRALDAARARWRRFDGAAHYRMRLSLDCFCAQETRGPHRVEVRDGRPMRRPALAARRYATVWRLFARVQDAIDQRVAVLVVRYDEHGVPRELSVDVSPMIADEEIGIRVTRFRALG